MAWYDDTDALVLAKKLRLQAEKSEVRKGGGRKVCAEGFMIFMRILDKMIDILEEDSRVCDCLIRHRGRDVGVIVEEI